MEREGMMEGRSKRCMEMSNSGNGRKGERGEGGRGKEAGKRRKKAEGKEK